MSRAKSQRRQEKQNATTEHTEDTEMKISPCQFMHSELRQSGTTGSVIRSIGKFLGMIAAQVRFFANLKIKPDVNHSCHESLAEMALSVSVFSVPSVAI
jgi:hypothetical protein